MAVLTFAAVIHKEDDLYVADCPEVGTVSQGYTLEEAIANLREATELFLEEFPPPEATQTFLTTFRSCIYHMNCTSKRSARCEPTTNTCSFNRMAVY
jgi:predicted RNase H-like HicB family nuclease